MPMYALLKKTPRFVCTKFALATFSDINVMSILTLFDLALQHV
jgi:hypothetical protein